MRIAESKTASIPHSPFYIPHFNKKPQPSWGRKLGSREPNCPPFPAEGLRDQSKSDRFPGSRLPTLHAFPGNTQWLEKRLMAYGGGLKAKFFRVLPCTLSLMPWALYLLWISFRSQLRGSGGFAPPSLAVSRYFKKFLRPPVKKAFSHKLSAVSNRNYLF